MGRGVIRGVVLLAAVAFCTASCGKKESENHKTLHGERTAVALWQGAVFGDKFAVCLKEQEEALEIAAGSHYIADGQEAQEFAQSGNTQGEEEGKEGEEMGIYVPEPGQVMPVAQEFFAERAGEYVIAYYPSWAQYDRKKLQVEEIDASMLTHIHYAFAETTEKYAPFSEDIVVHENNLRALVRLRGQNPDLKLVLSVGGAGGDRYFAPMCAQDEGIAVFTKGCVDFLQEYDFDGIDLDWEFPQTQEETAGFTRLVHCLRYHLDLLGERTGKHYSLSLAGAADVGTLKGIDYATIGPYLDYVFIMGYNLYGPWNDMAGFNAPLYAPGEQEAEFGAFPDVPGGEVYSLNAIVKTYLNGGLAANQLVLGLPFYGYVMPVVEAGNVGPGKTIDKNSTEETYVDCRTVFERYLGSPAYTEGWDETAQSPYLDGDGKFISYEDERSIKAKCGLVGRYGLAGAGFWELSQDTEDFRLLKVVWEAMERLRLQDQNAAD